MKIPLRYSPFALSNGIQHTILKTTDGKLFKENGVVAYSLSHYEKNIMYLYLFVYLSRCFIIGSQMSSVSDIVKECAPRDISLEAFEKVVGECQLVISNANTIHFTPDLANLTQNLFNGVFGVSFNGNELQRISNYVSSFHSIQAEQGSSSLPDQPSFDVELVLVNEFEFVFIGSNSKSFTFKETDSKLKMSINMDLNLLQYNQIGLLYEFIEFALIVKSLKNTVNSKRSNSNTIIAFNNFIKQQLNQFTSYLNKSFQQFNDFGFIKLKSIIYDWEIKLKFIHWLSSRSLILPDYKFLETLTDYKEHGNYLISQLSISAFEISSIPYVNSIKQWIINGTIPENDGNNGNNQFFIQKDSILISENVPVFLKPSFYKIYQIGSTFNYIKLVLKDYKWCDEFNLKYSQNCDPFNSKLIDEIFNCIINHFNNKVLNSYLNEISNLNKFLLLKQGDLISSIISIGSEALNESTVNLSSYKLIQILQDSIESTSVKINYPSNVYNRLDARLLNIESNGSIGWKLFTLDYHLLDEINVIIGNEYREYLRVFNFLIQIKRIEYQLSKCWVDSNKLNKFKRSKFQSKLFIKLNILRHQFLSFIHTIYQYILIEIIDESYSKFQNNFKIDPNKLIVKNGKIITPSINFTFNDIQLWHKQYIESISRCELFSSNSILPILLREIIEIIDLFCSMNIQFDKSLRQISSSVVSEELNDLINERFKWLMSQLNKEIVEKFEDKLNYLIFELKNINLNELAMLLII